MVCVGGAETLCETGQRLGIGAAKKIGMPEAAGGAAGRDRGNREGEDCGLEQIQGLTGTDDGYVEETAAPIGKGGGAGKRMSCGVHGATQFEFEGR